MGTQYRGATHRCGDGVVPIGKSTTDRSAEGWEPVQSWRWTDQGVEKVAFLMASKEVSEAKPATFEPERRPCDACEGRGSHDPGETHAMLHRMADMYARISPK